MNLFTRSFSFLTLALCAIAAAACSSTTQQQAASPQAAARRPNIIVIMADDHAAHAISCYGSIINKTPGIDRLAREGMRFTNCVCENSLCSPSRAAILTGKYSSANGVPDLSSPLPRNQIIFPNLLAAAGYQTAVIGKWHLHRNPTGFDHFDVFPDQGDYYDPMMISGGADGQGTRTKSTGYATDIVTDKSIDWLKHRDQGKPFMLLCWHKAPHRPWIPKRGETPVGLAESDDIPTPPTFDDDYATRSDAARRQTMSIAKDLNAEDLKQPIPSSLTGEELKRWKYERFIKDYLRCVATLDDNVARLLGYLDSSGLSEDTIVVYTSDQGFYLGDHGWYDKRFMYEEALRMPLLVRYPGHVQPGTVCGSPVVNIDFAPTLLDLVGVAAPSGKDAMQGVSIRLLLEGRTPSDWRTATYYHYYEAGPPHNVTPHYGVRTDRYKLIYFLAPVNAWELYDLQADPRELHNRYGEPGYEAITVDLAAQLNRLRAQYNEHDAAQTASPQAPKPSAPK
ncbi:MAG: sulfatase [Phycisphaerales bacterium]